MMANYFYITDGLVNRKKKIVYKKTAMDQILHCVEKMSIDELISCYNKIGLFFRHSCSIDRGYLKYICEKQNIKYKPLRFTRFYERNNLIEFYHILSHISLLCSDDDLKKIYDLIIDKIVNSNKTSANHDKGQELLNEIFDKS